MSIETTLSAPSAQTLADRWAAVRKRSLPMSLTFASLLLTALLAAFLWPATYTSVGTILIEQQELPADLVRSTISSFADQRLQVIKQRVMTTENLMGIIQRYDLYADLRRKRVREVVIDTMRKDIRFELISADVIDPRSGHPTKATIAFSVSYSNRSPEVAAKVANELVTLFLQENLDNRKKRAADATNFLDEEADRLGKHIAEVQAQISAFKEQHLNDLPELTQINLQLLTRSEEETRDVDSRLRSLDQQIVYLDGQLAQISPSSQVYTSTGERVLSPTDRLKFLRTEYARVSAIYAPTHPDVIRLQREIDGLEKDVGAVNQVNDLERQLKDTSTKLASLQERYAADHPDVVRLSRLKESLAAEIAHLRAAPSVPATDTVAPDNPAYIQLKAQREASVGERDSLNKQREKLQARLHDLERRLESAPGVEREYSTLLRESENTQLKYREVRQKQMEAQVAQNLEDERKGERFTLIEPPLVPGEPASPNRAAIIVAGIVLAIGAAIGLALLLDSFDTSVRGKRDLEALLKIPPLAVLPWIDTAHDIAMRARRARYAVAGAVSVVLLTAVAIHLFYRPLDVLWQVALRRLG